MIELLLWLIMVIGENQYRVVHNDAGDNSATVIRHRGGIRVHGTVRPYEHARRHIGRGKP